MKSCPPVFALLAHSDRSSRTRKISYPPSLIRDTTSAIASESDSDSLIASPSSFHEMLQLLIHSSPRCRDKLSKPLDAFFARNGSPSVPVRHCTPEAVKIEGVSPLSTARKLGAVARVAGKQVRRSRTVGAFGRHSRHRELDD